MTKEEIRRINTTPLAYLGDAVFEVIVREKIVTEKPGDVGRAHHTAVRYVSAGGQAKAAKAMINEGFLTEEEEKIYKQRFSKYGIGYTLSLMEQQQRLAASLKARKEEARRLPLISNTGIFSFCSFPVNGRYLL